MTSLLPSVLVLVGVVGFNGCWNSAHFSVLINGSPMGHVRVLRGLHQGDPLSPLLLVLAIEALGHLFLKAQSLDLVSSF